MWGFGFEDLIEEGFGFGGFEPPVLAWGIRMRV